jgi:hypothetical protein
MFRTWLVVMLALFAWLVFGVLIGAFSDIWFIASAAALLVSIWFAFGIGLVAATLMGMFK